MVILLRLYLLEQCLDPVFRSSIKTLNFVTFEEFLIHVGMHHASIWDEDKDECEVSPDTNDGENHGINLSKCFEQFMELMNCNKLDAVVSRLALNLI